MCELPILPAPAVSWFLMDPRRISIEDYTYHLPDEKIAMFPLQERDSSKLLIAHEGTLKDERFRNLADSLPENALIVFNNTRVVEARMIFEKFTGARIELFCLEPSDPALEINVAMQQRNKVQWNCMIGGASKWKPGQILTKELSTGTLEARYVEKKSDCFVIELSWPDTSVSFAEILHEAGNMPLPPYIKRQVYEDDKSRYQTVYARHEGSVAAPTAGLHFTHHILSELKEKNIEPLYVTLHVGAGTFKPVKAEQMADHHMHAEFIEVQIDFLRRFTEADSRTAVAVGTTSLRTLESLYWLAVDIMTNNISPGPEYELDQWFPYNHQSTTLSRAEAMQILITHLELTGTERLITKTRLLIVPGYKFRMVDILITNFHQPRSTLLLLVAAFVGKNWKNIYEHALNNDYRFLSYGDSCLLMRE